jgi:hypothetical protein
MTNAEYIALFIAGLVVSSSLAFFAGEVIGFRRGAKVGLKKLDDLIAVERQCAQWQMADQRYNCVVGRRSRRRKEASK